MTASAAAVAPVRRTCMRDQVRDLIVERILDGGYPAGTRLKELALAAECNVSQAPVREALRELEALGLVQSEHYRGTRVRGVDLVELREAYELRALLEERAAQLAVPCAADVLDGLRAELARMRRTLKQRDEKDYAIAVSNFHRLIVAASGNATFLRTWDALHWEVRARVAGAKIRERGVGIDSFIDAHATILALLEAGDGEQAGRRIRELIARVLSLFETQAPARSSTAAAPEPRRKRARIAANPRLEPSRLRS